MNKLTGYLLRWLIFAAIWFIFVYQVSLWEGLAAGGAAALTLFSLEKARKYEPLRFRPRARWLAQVWRLPKPIATDIWRLIRTLARQIVGGRSQASFLLVPFRSARKGPRGAAQRALVVLFGTTPPNAVVVEFNPDKSYLMVHQLEKTPVSPLIRELEQ